MFCLFRVFVFFFLIEKKREENFCFVLETEDRDRREIVSIWCKGGGCGTYGVRK